MRSNRTRSTRSLTVLAALGLAAGCAGGPDGEDVPGRNPGAHLVEAVAHPERPAADRARDDDRRPAEVLAFFGIEPGDRVVELMAARGYYTEILARAIGPEGRLWAHNNAFVLDRFAREPLAARLARLDLERVAALESELHDLELPTDLDAVLLIRFYHDLFWMPGPDGSYGTTDRTAVHRRVYEALRPGGVYGIVDHHAEAGSGARDALDRERGLHRVDRELVVREVSACGFVLDGESDVLANPEDTRDWNIFVDGGTRRDSTDRFVLRFRKPIDQRSPSDRNSGAR